MKKQILTLVGLGLFLVSMAAFAQNLPVKANIPFDFVAGKATIPSGEYRIEAVNDSSRALVIRSASGKGMEMVLSTPCESLNAADATKLVFNRYGDRYFLSQIWVAGEKAGHALPKTHRERELARDYPAQQVVLMAQTR